MRHGGNGAASKRVGRWYLLLVVLGTTGALALAWRFDLNVATTAATLLPTVAPLFLAWKTFRHDRIEAAGDLVGRTVDHRRLPDYEARLPQRTTGSILQQ